MTVLLKIDNSFKLYFSAPLGAFDLLTEVYEELVFSHDSIHHSKHAAAVLPVVLQTLKTPLEGDNSSIQKKCARMVKAVKLLLGRLKNFNRTLTLKCLSIGTPKIINFPFVSNGKFMVFTCPKYLSTL